MRLIRIYTAGSLAAGARLTLSARASNHLSTVLRLQRGATLQVFNGQGQEHAATLLQPHHQHAEILLSDALPTLPESPLRITLAQGISRGDRMDYAIQKATELGVTDIIPLLCERSVVRLDASQAARKHEHWTGIAISAAEQSGRAHVPHIALAQRYADYAGKPLPDARCRLVLDPNATAGPSALAPAGRPIDLLIGPEGGLTAQEISIAKLGDFSALKLGPRVLRTETAAAAAMTALQTLYGDLG